MTEYDFQEQMGIQTGLIYSQKGFNKDIKKLEELEGDGTKITGTEAQD